MIADASVGLITPPLVPTHTQWYIIHMHSLPCPHTYAHMPQVHLYQGTGKAIVAHNMMQGSMGIQNDATNNATIIINDNVSDD